MSPNKKSAIFSLCTCSLLAQAACATDDEGPEGEPDIASAVASTGYIQCGNGKYVHGQIGGKFLELGGCSSTLLGWPTTNETATPDGIGRFNHFQNKASIYWTPGTGPWSVHGKIRDKWASLGWERSSLGYPISDEFATYNDGGIPSGRESAFEFGSTTGMATPRRCGRTRLRRARSTGPRSRVIARGASRPIPTGGGTPFPI